MKLLLIILPMSSKEKYGTLADVGTLYPSLGLAYVAAYAEMDGHEVKVIDCEAEEKGYDDINTIALGFQPDLVGMQTYCTNINKVFKIAKSLKGIVKTRVVLGGAHATLDPMGAITNEHVDFVIRGEGEIGLARLLKALGSKTFSDIPGLVYKENNEIKINKPVEPMPCLDDIPFPARHLFPMDRYHSSANLRGKRTLNIMTSRGCPFRCLYCAGSLIFGTSHRFNSTERIIEEIKSLKEKYNIDSLQFYDETFTLNKERINELCDTMIKEKLNLEWSCFTRVDLVSKDLLTKMKEAGCYLIFYGLESGVQRLLDLIEKDITLQACEKAIKISHKLGIETWASFMLGLPTETLEDSYRTIDFAIELSPTFAQFTFATPFPGTGLYDLAACHGKVKTDWGNFTGWSEAAFIPHGRKEEEMKSLVKLAYRRFYLRPNYMLKIIPSIARLPFNKSLALIKAGVLTLFTK